MSCFNIVAPYAPSARSFTRIAPLLAVLCMPALAGAQTTSGDLKGEKTLAPGIAATTRYAERLDVPRVAGPNLGVHVELGSWRLSDPSREIRVPPQGFYIADLRNGDVVTVIDGEEKHRHTGERWTVKPGQSMVVKILDKRQQNVLLHIFSVRPVP